MINTLYYILKFWGSELIETLFECESSRMMMKDEILRLILEIDFCRNEIEITGENNAQLFIGLGHILIELESIYKDDENS